MTDEPLPVEEEEVPPPEPEPDDSDVCPVCGRRGRTAHGHD